MSTPSANNNASSRLSGSVLAEQHLINDPWEATGIDEEERRESWLLNYVDILTLLLTLFVLLLALQPKEHHPPAAEPPAAATAEQPATQADIPAATETLASTKPTTDTPAREQTASNPAPAGLTQLIETSGLDDRIRVSLHRESAQLEIQDNILFTAGSVDLKEQGKQLLDELAQVFLQQHSTLLIQGHTDNRPIHTARFPSNWELSAGRATRVARYLIDRGVVPERLQAVGLADTQPVAGNETPQGRARNRRVTLVVKLPDARAPDMTGAMPL